jgi:hypothetical protein
MPMLMMTATPRYDVDAHQHRHRSSDRGAGGALWRGEGNAAHAANIINAANAATPALSFGLTDTLIASAALPSLPARRRFCLRLIPCVYTQPTQPVSLSGNPMTILPALGLEGK